MPASVTYDEDTLALAAVIYRNKQRTAAKRTSRPIWQPYESSPQELALHTAADELFYGGAAGGGKTDFLIGLALTKHKSSIIFRREFPQLDAIIARADEIVSAAIETLQLDKKPKYNATTHKWRNLPGNRTLQFGAMVHEKDKEKYQGRPHDLKGYDEITQFTRSQYTYTSAWNRTTIPNQRARTVATGNPPMTPEGEWVIEYWSPWLDGQYPNPAVPGELRWFASVDGEDREVEDDTPIPVGNLTVRPRSRTFIPARLTDNPLLMITNYGNVLHALPEPMRSQLLFGDFNIQPLSDEWQIIPTEWIQLAQERWLKNPDRQTILSAIGLDVSRGGKDKTTIAHRYENFIDTLIEHSGKNTPDGEAAAKHVIESLDLDPDNFTNASYAGSRAALVPINVDVVGPGSSAYDMLKFVGLDTYPVHFNAATEATDRTGVLEFANLRAEAYWMMREMLDPVYGIDVRLPPDRELAAELAAVRWKYTPRGILVEDKDEVIKRLGRSPDKADTVVMAFLDMQGRKAEPNIPTSQSFRTYTPRSAPLPVTPTRSHPTIYVPDTTPAFMQILQDDAPDQYQQGAVKRQKLSPYFRRIKR